MSRWLPERPWRLWVGRDALTLADATGQTRATLALDSATPDWAGAFARLAQAAALPAGTHVEATVSDDWARYAMLTVPEGTARADELRTLAGQRFEALFGLSPQTWRIEADWRTRGRIAACALPAALVTALRAPPAQAWRLRSAQPATWRLLAQHAGGIPRDAWVACAGEGGVCLLRLAAGRVTHVRRHLLAALPEGAALTALCDAERLREGDAAHVPLHLLGDWPGT
ncbi:MAG: hypothetical protein REI09_15190, partial [Candidatus Dactylopiibacterium sp.]|nr:hypothetical protein [Candidatus Dactylopiibacterium sp.]